MTESTTAGDLGVTLVALNVYPIKSCAGVALTESLLVETGLEFDRAWMVVDGQGRGVTQRELPRLALVRPALRSRDMVLRAPGMLALHIAFDAVEAPVRVTVGHDEVAAFDMGALAAQWFSDFLGAPPGRPEADARPRAELPLRLVRFDPAHKRLSDREWTGEIAAENAFSDCFPLNVLSTASLAEVNRRLAAAGEPSVTMERFRPNLVLDGLDAHGEDALDEIWFETAEGSLRLKIAGPCPRCQIPDVDPATAVPGHAVGEALAGYRADARVQGAITFGMNAVIVAGIDCTLRPGMAARASWKFD